MCRVYNESGKNRDSFTGRSGIITLFDKNLNKLLGIYKTELIDSDTYALRVIEEASNKHEKESYYI